MSGFWQMINQHVVSLNVVAWCGAISTLAIYSILYKENKIYRFFEHLFIGLATGYGIYFIWTNVLLSKWWEPMMKGGEWYWIFALAAGGLYYCIYSKKYAWMSRLIIGIMMGLAAGSYFRGFVSENWPQLLDSFRPILNTSYTALPLVGWHLRLPDWNNLIFVVTLVTVMSYFFFSFEHKGKVIRGSAKTGRWLLMVAFGAMFGSTVMARVSLFISRLWFLFGEWIHLFPTK